MPKYKSSVRCRTKKIKLTRKTIGAREKYSYIPSHAGSSDTNTVFPASDDICTENSKEEGTAYTRAKRKELSLWDTLKDQVLEESLDEQSITEPMGLTEVLSREPTSDNTTNVCNICHCLFSDEKKNAKKKWREWRRCNTCEQWSHLACGFKKNLCRHCQTPRS